MVTRCLLTLLCKRPALEELPSCGAGAASPGFPSADGKMRASSPWRSLHTGLNKGFHRGFDAQVCDAGGLLNIPIILPEK